MQISTPAPAVNQTPAGHLDEAGIAVPGLHLPGKK